MLNLPDKLSLHIMYPSTVGKLAAGLFCIFLLPICTQAQANPFVPPWTNDPTNSGTVKGEQFDGKPVYFNGPYRFWGCTEDQGRGLIRTFAYIGYFLSERVIPDSRKGSYSTYGFSTWFSRNDKAVITDVFKKINNGYVEPPRSVSDDNPRQYIPDFGCFDPNSKEFPANQKAAVQKVCGAYNMGFTLNDTNLIWLCPRFFANSAQFPALPDIVPHSQCQPLNARGTKFGGPVPQRFFFSKIILIVSTLASKYMPLGPQVDHLDMNGLAELPTEKQVFSDTSYAMYAQCESLRCFSFPTRSYAPFPLSHTFSRAAYSPHSSTILPSTNRIS